MLSFEWNGLRAGDRVFMHDGTKAARAVVPGVVTAVELHKVYNGVGITVARAGGRQAIVWPSPFVVHHDASDQRCWRCQAA